MDTFCWKFTQIFRLKASRSNSIQCFLVTVGDWLRRLKVTFPRGNGFFRKFSELWQTFVSPSVLFKIFKNKPPMGLFWGVEFTVKIRNFKTLSMLGEESPLMSISGQVSPQALWHKDTVVIIITTIARITVSDWTFFLNAPLAIRWIHWDQIAPMDDHL